MGMREKLMQLIEEADDTCDNTRCSDCEYNGQDCWTRLIAETLIANDVVPVVRCKDCKHYEKDGSIYRCVDWKGLFGNCKPDDFCSYGERKDNK